MPKVSIIMTTYKHQSFIAQTIESILNQTFADWELLIGDDSPNNETRNIMQPYIEKHSSKIKAWHHHTNKGIVNNMNFLLSQVSKDSEYIAFLEGDDLRHFDYLAEKFKIFQKYPKVGLVYNELSLIDENNTIKEKRWLAPRTHKRYKNETDTLGHYISSDMICFGFSTLMSRNYIYINNYGKKDLMGTEGDFFLQIATKHHIYGIQTPLSAYRRHSHNTSSDLTVSISHFEFLMEKYIETGKVDPLSTTKVRILIAMMRSFAHGQKRQRKLFFRDVADCFHLSISQTFVVGFQSVRYRMLKPVFYSLFSHKGKKRPS